MNDYKLNYKNYITILGSIPLFANEWMILNMIISVKYQYLKTFNCVQIKLLVIAIFETI